MNGLFRPSILVILMAGLAVAASLLVLWPRSQDIQAVPLKEGEQEIVWLYPATTASTWERFVSAVDNTVHRLQEEGHDIALNSDRAFPPQTTAIPELALSFCGGKSRLVFRWYKLTSDHKTQQWVEKLCNGSRRPPLAIIGGSSSTAATELLCQLQEHLGLARKNPIPLALLTTATADNAPELSIEGRPEQERLTDAANRPAGHPLTRIYSGRTYRFCFTNGQMARAVTEFIWSRDELRPDVDVIYQVIWLDDAYSIDLTERFAEALRLPITARAVSQQWAWATGNVSTGGVPIDLAGIEQGHFAFPFADRVDFTVGGFDQPNRWELPVIKRLVDAKVTQHPRQQRPLLILTAASSQPARRFLRGLSRTAPTQSRRFVVATGDSLSFNTIFRDRNVAWPIQDLPYDLVFFCHRNPVDRSADSGRHKHDHDENGSATGTEDLLLYTDMVEAIVRATITNGAVPTTPDELGDSLRQARWYNGQISYGNAGPLLFDEDGNRLEGTGGHVVWLRPIMDRDRVEPRAAIEIWAIQPDPTDGRRWQRQRVIDVDYDQVPGER